jgi:hypothetical protein
MPMTLPFLALEPTYEPFENPVFPTQKSALKSLPLALNGWKMPSLQDELWRSV